MMTFREKMQKEHPNRIYTGCPRNYFNHVKEDLCVGRLDPSREKCTKCWDREIPTTLEAKKEMTIDEAIKHCHEVTAGELCEGTVNHKACGSEHKQLGEWLEEYKIFKEKATPEAPNFEGDGIDNNGNIIFDTWICPNCDREYEIDYEEHDYCPFCGKAILWDYPDEDIPEEE